LIPFGGGAIMNVLAFMAMGYSLLEQAEPLANTFISAGGNLTVGNQMASFAAKGAGLASRPVTWAAGKAGGAVAGAAKKGLSKVGGAIGSARQAAIGHFAGAGGDLPTTGDKFKRALFGAGLGKGYFDTVSGKTDAPEGIAGSFGRLTPSAAGAVSSKANTTLDKMKAAAQNKDKKQARSDLQKMINDSKTPEERQAKVAAAQQLLKNGKVDDKTADSLKDAYALQEMSANRMSDKEVAARASAESTEAKQKAYDEAGVSALAVKSEISARLSRLESDLAAIESAVANAKSVGEVREALSGRSWESGSERDMVSVAERVFNSKGLPGMAGHTAQGLMNDFMAQMGAYGTAANNISREMGQRISDAASKGEVARLSALVADLKRQVEAKKG